MLLIIIIELAKSGLITENNQPSPVILQSIVSMQHADLEGLSRELHPEAHAAQPRTEPPNYSPSRAGMAVFYF